MEKGITTNLGRYFDGDKVEFKITFTTACSMKCDTCLQREIKKHYHIDKELYKSIIQQIVDLDIKKKTVSFYSIGESYLYPEFASLCEWAIEILHKHEIKTTIVTNGTHIDRIPKGIDNFFISFNAGRKESYEKITGYSFEKVRDNIFRLYNEGEFKNAKKAQIHMLCFDENKGEENDFLETFRSLKGIGYRFSYKYDNQHEETEHSGREEQYNGGRKRIPCSYVTRSIVIYSNGDVVRCCHDFFDEYSYGNLNENTLEDIIKSETRIKVFKDHMDGKYREICAKCDFNTVGSDEDFVSGMFDPMENCIYQTLRSVKRTAKRILKK